MKEIKNQKLETDILKFAARASLEDVYKKFNSSKHGLKAKDVKINRQKFGTNEISRHKEKSFLRRLIKSFIDPFTIILLCLVLVLGVTDVVVPIIQGNPDDVELFTIGIITVMVLISGILRFVQETRSGKAAQKLLAMITTTTCIERQKVGANEIPLDDVVVGDIVHLSAGDIVPADVRIVEVTDLFISQSSLTGESEPVEKVIKLSNENVESVIDYDNLAFMGTNVVSGSAKAIALNVGDQTIFGSMAQSLNKKPEPTSFEKGVNSVSWVLIRFMLVMIPLVFLLNGITKADWLSAFFFAISIGVGLTPEMLPMIVTTCLAKGAVGMSKKKTIIKDLNSIQNFGAINVLCTDKTGTITQDKIALQFHLDVHGEESFKVLKYGFLNSFYQTGLKNLLDKAVISRTEEESRRQQILADLSDNYKKTDEVPFDFQRRRMSVVVSNKDGATEMITKGAVEEMLGVCSFVEDGDKLVPLDAKLKAQILDRTESLNDDGMRVLIVAKKTDHAPIGRFGVKDESEMILIGYLAFLDPPKETTATAIKALSEHGVVTKILTGDNEKVARQVCRQVGLDVEHYWLGSDIDKMSDEKLAREVEATTIFAKLSPEQKVRVVSTLRKNGHTVGYMGDGINDAAAMKAADVGISVDTGVDIAKESANIILLEKDLMVLEQGIIEGRKTYANMIKYIKMTASSNFGNVFAVLLASAFLPFLPMMSIHLLLLNLIYDISCTAIPWDNVDEEFLKKPRKWNSSSIASFMKWIGPISSIFDIVTFLILYFIICPAVVSGGVLFHELPDSEATIKLLYIAVFQAGWFVESMWSQTLVIHMIRTAKVPFLQSRASLPLTVLTFAGIIILSIIPYTIVGDKIGLAPLPLEFWYWLAGILVAYMALVGFVKKIYIKRYNEWL